MPRTCVVKLGEIDYTIPALDIDQLERVTEMYAELGTEPSKADPMKVARLPYKIVRVALERCIQPSPVGTVSPGSMDEVRIAMEAILAMSGLQQTPNPPKAVEAQAA